MRYIIHYTNPGEFILDGFAGTGMTGVAARLCGNRTAVEELGYRVSPNQDILAPANEGGKTVWKPISKLGERHAILNDLSTAATFIAHNFNTPISIDSREEDARKVIRDLERDFGWMFQTLHEPTAKEIESAVQEISKSSSPTLQGRIGRINYTVWSDVFSCPECSSEIIYWDSAVDKVDFQVKSNFDCPSCGKD